MQLRDIAWASLRRRPGRGLFTAGVVAIGIGTVVALPRDLSGGEQQRVAIARAIVNSPALLLADEPTGCLDSRTGREVIDVLQRLREDGLTVFLVTHDAAVAARADRTVHVQDGRVRDGASGILQTIHQYDPAFAHVEKSRTARGA